ncbi:MAG: hypothetical protein J6328_07020 [Bacilli bacterium]|nr:hypothetical protein [Bacilli bacterium]
MFKILKYMNDSPSKRTIERKDIRAALGFLLIALSLLGYLVPGTTLRFYDYPAVFLFGLLGYWLFWGVIALLGVYLMAKNSIKAKLPIGRIVLALIVISLGASSLLSCIGSGHANSVDIKGFVGDLNSAIVPIGSGSYPLDISLGGGLIGYALLSLFLLPGLMPLSFAFAIVLIVIGLVIAFWKQIVAFFHFLSAKRVVAKSKKEREKDAPESLFAETPMSNEDLNTVYEAPSLPKPKDEDTIEKPTTRSELYHQKPDFSSNPSSPLSPFDSFGFANSNTQGLQEAVFSLDEKPTEEPKKEKEPEPFEPLVSFDLEEKAEDTPEEGELDVTPSFLSIEAEVASPEAPAEEETINEPLSAEETPIVIPNAPIIEPKVEPTPAVAAPLPKVEEKVIEPIIEAKPEVKKPLDEQWITFGPVKQRAVKKRPVYKMPNAELLKTYDDDPHAAQNEADCLERSELINQAFRDLKVGAFVESHTIGPSVTRYNIKTDASVSISAVKRIVDDVMVRLGGVLGRFQDVVQGSSTSGLEIPNKVQSLVSFRETFLAMPTDEKSNLFIPFGKSIEGKVVSADMSDFPHMLVSGSTGSGKSIFIHGLIMSLIMRNRPEDLKLVLVDPKRVEMGKYREIPHLLCPIIKEPTHAKVAMSKLCDEMERRYTLFEESNVSNIRQFNADVAPEKGCEKLPFIIVIVDEYADLVDTCKDIGEPIVRLAQKARAAGIHLVIATQRPDTNVINGRIKANIAVRVALSLSSATDSMTVLGEGGAEKLSGHGDMLVKCDSVSRAGFTRLQGCFVSNGEIKAVVDMIKEQQRVIYDPNFIDLEDHSNDLEVPTMVGPTANDVRRAADEDKYEMIKEAIMAQEYTSISQIQRTFGVGFPRAGKIFNRLQAEGIVAAKSDSPSSSKGCRVLIHANTLNSENPGSLSQSEVVPSGFPAPGDDY